jgi:hypothetical protein
MTDALKSHWPEYLIEAAGLGLFMIAAFTFGAILEHPVSPVRGAASVAPNYTTIIPSVASSAASPRDNDSHHNRKDRL